MTIKMVATDIDGTILPYTGGFTTEVIQCIHNLEENNIKVVLVTGRMYRSSKKIADEIGLNTSIVAYQGGLVLDEKGKVLYERYIPNEMTKNILNWAKKQNVYINLYMNDNLYVEKENEYTLKYATHQKIPFEVTPFDNLKIDNVNKVLMIDYNDSEKISRITEQLQKDFPELYIVKSTDFFCEVCHKEATKGDGLKCLQNYYGITKEETLSIGDHNNDFELLMSGGTKIAMGNATDELKAMADYITDTVDNNGFVKAMDKYILKEGANV